MRISTLSASHARVGTGIGGFGTIAAPIAGALVVFALRGLLADFAAWYMILWGIVALGSCSARRKGAAARSCRASACIGSPRGAAC